MQSAVGPAKHMTGILMGAETQDSHGHKNTFVQVGPDVSVYDSVMSDSLIPVGRLIEAGFAVIRRIPSQAKNDGFSNRSALWRHHHDARWQDNNCHEIRLAHMASSPTIHKTPHKIESITACHF